MTKHDDDEVVVVGEKLPRLVSIVPLDDFNVAVTWEAGTRPKEREIADLGPALFRYKVYARLRDDPDLFRTIHLQQHRFGVAWGNSDEIDMGASTIADLADETMQSADFSEFMRRHGFTLDRVASELGISRRMAAYYKKEHKVPRYIGLACAYLDIKAQQQITGTVVSTSGALVGHTTTLTGALLPAFLGPHAAVAHGYRQAEPTEEDEAPSTPWAPQSPSRPQEKFQIDD